MKFIVLTFICGMVAFPYVECIMPHILNDMGCWKDTSSRAVPKIEQQHPLLHQTNYRARTNALQKCAEAARSKGYNFICVQHGGWCASSATARHTYQKYGRSSNCAADGEGGPWANHCYEVDIVWDVKFNPFGCYLDKAARDMPTLEGTSGQLDGAYQHRDDAIRKCARVAAASGYGNGKYIAIQNGGWCAADHTTGSYGKSSACADNGKGGPWANAVYRIEKVTKIKVTPVGCWKDQKDRNIRPAEHSSPDLSGAYQTRPDAIARCARHAKMLGNSHFALQNGGWCATSKNAKFTYNDSGVSTACKPDGKGGPWANQVYEIN